MDPVDAAGGELVELILAPAHHPERCVEFDEALHEGAPDVTGCTGDEDLDGLLTWTLIRAAHPVERRLTALFAEHGLSPVQFGLLAHLSIGRASTSAQLARDVLIRPQSIAGVVDGLVDRGLVARSGPRTRGRPNPIELSGAGHALLADVWPGVLAANRPGPLGLEPPAAAELNRLLHLLIGHEPDGPTAPGGA